MHKIKIKDFKAREKSLKNAEILRRVNLSSNQARWKVLKI